MGAIFENADSKGDGAEGAKSVKDNLRSKCKVFAKREADEARLKPDEAVSESEYPPLPRRKRN
jgi:hypothetical protein